MREAFQPAGSICRHGVGLVGFFLCVPVGNALERVARERYGCEQRHDVSQDETCDGRDRQDANEFTGNATDSHQRREREDCRQLASEGRHGIAINGAERRFPKALVVGVDVLVKPFHHQDEHIDEQAEGEHHADDDQLVERIPHQQDDDQYPAEGDRDRQACDKPLAPSQHEEQDDEHRQHRLPSVVEDVDERIPDRLGLVLHHGMFDALWPSRGLRIGIDVSQHVLDQLDRIGSGYLLDRKTYRRSEAFAVLTVESARFFGFELTAHSCDLAQQYRAAACAVAKASHR